MQQTLDQRRAQFAWETASRNVKEHHKDDVNLAKSAPALVMGSGLMPALAFYKSRKKPYANALVEDITRWLAKRSPGTSSEDFFETMNVLFNASSSAYMQATDETLSMLKWLRQFADALFKQEGLRAG